MSAWLRVGLLAVVLAGCLGVAPGAEAFSRDRGFQTCFQFTLGFPFGDTTMVLQMAGDRGRSFQLLGVVRFEGGDDGLTLPVSGVARRRADGDLEVDVGFTLAAPTLRLRMQVAGRLVAPHFDSGTGGFVATGGGAVGDGALTFTAVACPTTFGDFT